MGSLADSRRNHASWARRAISALAWAGPFLSRLGPVRSRLADGWEKKIRAETEKQIRSGLKPPGAIRDRQEIGIAIMRTVERALMENRLSRTSLDKFLNVLVGDAIINKGDDNAKSRFVARFGTSSPEILLISPTKACNLFCKGCYADSGATREKLEWEIIDRLITEAHDLWGARFIVLSGGEPLVYKDRGKGILDIIERHGDCFFMMYTNGTLINDSVAVRMGELGNVMPAISVEGLREKTDGRRGEGVFDRIIQAMERLRRERVFYGISMTATRDNAEEILSDQVINFYFQEMGVLFGWVFQYMPIGRAFTLRLLPTPEQRLWMWKRSRQLISERHLFLIDFWNGGTVSSGCISAGRDGGYMAVDWNGAFMPCVFMPYSPVNIHDIYAQGKNLIDVWADPFFARIRAWQRDYGHKKSLSEGGRHGNWIMPCPMRDHYAELYPLLREYNPTPVDENAAAALQDPEYREQLIEYNRSVGKLFDPIWESRYLHPEKEESSKTA